MAPYGIVSLGNSLSTLGASTNGVITRRGGNIAILANGTISLEQTRVFTLQGGDVLMWTSNGDITAGVGAKTNVTNVPLSFLLNGDGQLSVNVFGLQTGAGIGALDAFDGRDRRPCRSEEHTSELQSLMRISYAVFCLKKKKNRQYINKNQ